MPLNYKHLALAGIAAIMAPVILISTGQTSDHADTPQIVQNPGTDITDVYLFPSKQNNGHVVLAMNVNPLIGPGQGATTYFDPNVLYQFKIDTTGDFVEDLVIQARFTAKGPNQQVMLYGPSRPSVTGSENVSLPGTPSVGSINTTIRGRQGIKIFAGAREDSFFFDLERFFAILPDRATPLTGIDVPNPNEPQLTSWRAPGEAVDFLSNGGYNVLSIVLEMPKSMLGTKLGSKPGVISVWTTTSVPNGSVWTQRDRLARPVVNEVFATVANNRHKINNETSPVQDSGELRNDILGFMTFPAGRSEAIRNIIAAVLVPDVMTADLNAKGAAYLGFETGGATGGKFGGRALEDDVVDISLGVVFGTTISDLLLAPADGNQIPTLTSDNVGAGGKHFTNSFPYLGSPR
ncbi:MAG: DUF4331 family protein [Chlorobia bacterium]|nr:DUF4331 family protein [Fimbriimonadaceae bacterium]